MAQVSQIESFYAEKSVFITGGSGFLGKVIVEKLLRCCKKIKTVYILIRSNGEKSGSERIKEILQSEEFEKVRQQNPEAINKVKPICGDITYPGLGISFQDMVKLIDNVNIVFHSAATIRFDEPLKRAIDINLGGTNKVIELCDKLPKLKCLIHVSTAYCNITKKDIKEKVYKSSISPSKFLAASKWMDEDLLEDMSKKLYNGRPTSYHYTKALAENLILEKVTSVSNKSNYEISIIRPSIVTPSVKEPFPGWTNNYYGPTGYLVVSGKGVLRTMYAHEEKICDIIPVDVVANTAITSACFVSINKLTSNINEKNIRKLNTKNKEENNNYELETKNKTSKKSILNDVLNLTQSFKQQNITIFNCVSGTLNSISWGQIHEYCYPYLLEYPSKEIFRYPDTQMHSNKLIHQILMQIEHNIPAFFVDILFKSAGFKPILKPVYEKVHRAIDALEYFTTNEWIWETSNFEKLILFQNDIDKENFFINVSQINWKNYMRDYVLGIRTYLLKEDPSTIPIAKRNLNRVYYATQLTKLAIASCIFYQGLSGYSYAKEYFFKVVTNIIFKNHSKLKID